MPEQAIWWKGRIRDHHRSWDEIGADLSRSVEALAVDRGGSRGHYGDMMRQGAAVVPRVLLCVDILPPPPLGVPAGSVFVRSRRVSAERQPWKDLPAMEGVVEAEFVKPLHLGETLMPFRLLEPIRAVIPVSDGQLLRPQTFEMESHPGLSEWWQRAERTWVKHKSESTKISLIEQIDHMSKLTIQYPGPPIRVVYTGRGGRVAAAVETDPASVIDNALYWAPAGSIDEARYLVGLLNSDVLHNRTQDFYSKGLLGPRNIHKAAFGVPIPVFNPDDEVHRHIAEVAADCETAVVDVDASAKATSTNRTRFRDALEASGLMDRLNVAVEALLDQLESQASLPTRPSDPSPHD
jgi:hypothetical protein